MQSGPTAACGLVWSLCLVAAAAQNPPGQVRLRLLDADAKPVAGASVWTCPQCVWKRRTWLPAELLPFEGNQYEVLRRVGQPRTAGQDGELFVARETVVAVESGPLAGFAVVGADAPELVEIRVDDRRWTIVLRDAEGKPVVDIPIALQAKGSSDEAMFSVPLGLTDATGRLVVRAPGCIEVPTPEMTEVEVVEVSGQGEGAQAPAVAPKPPEPPKAPAPTTVLVVVEGMYMPSHGVELRLDDPQPTIGLTMPRATLVEVRLPDWNGPIADFAFLENAGKKFEPDGSPCWLRDGRLVGLVGGSTIRVMAGWHWLPESRTDFEVPRLPLGQTFPIDLELAPEDIVLRARLHDALGKPVAATELEIRPEGKSFVTTNVRTDRAGRFALVLHPGRAAGTRVVVRVRACVNLEHLERAASFVLPELEPGDRRDLGILSLDTK